MSSGSDRPDELLVARKGRLRSRIADRLSRGQLPGRPVSVAQALSREAFARAAVYWNEMCMSQYALSSNVQAP